MSLIPYLLQKCHSANAIMNKMSVPRSSAARARPVLLQCAAPSRPPFSALRRSVRLSVCRAVFPRGSTSSPGFSDS